MPLSADKLFTISVLVPTRNRSGFLLSALNDIYAQDFTGQIEVLVSDNASTDDTACILDSYHREKFTKRGWSLRVWRHTENIGIVKNFDFLLEQATGRYIAYHLDDDRWMPDYLSSAINGLTVHPQCSTYLTANRTHNDEGGNGPGWLEIHHHPLTGKPPSQGVHSLNDILSVMVSRPACNLSQIVFVNNGLRPDIRDGAHFDLVFMVNNMAYAKVFVDHEARCSFRVSLDAYGRNDVLANQGADNMEYSYAFVNLLAKLQKYESMRQSKLSEVAILRAVKSIVHFAKAVKNRQFRLEFLILSLKLCIGCIFCWRISDRNNFSLS